jgi:hypothetical protein
MYKMSCDFRYIVYYILLSEGRDATLHKALRTVNQDSIDWDNCPKVLYEEGIDAIYKYYKEEGMQNFIQYEMSGDIVSDYGDDFVVVKVEELR